MKTFDFFIEAFDLFKKSWKDLLRVMVFGFIATSLFSVVFYESSTNLKSIFEQHERYSAELTQFEKEVQAYQINSSEEALASTEEGKAFEEQRHRLLQRQTLLPSLGEAQLYFFLALALFALGQSWVDMGFYSSALQITKGKRPTIAIYFQNQAHYAQYLLAYLSIFAMSTVFAELTVFLAFVPTVLFSFFPFFVLDREQGAWEALKASSLCSYSKLRRVLVFFTLRTLTLLACFMAIALPIVAPGGWFVLLSLPLVLLLPLSFGYFNLAQVRLYQNQ